MRKFILPVIMVLCGIFSLTTLGSVAEDLVPIQFMFLVTGFGIALLLSQVKFSWLTNLSPVWYLSLVALLLLTLVLGNVTRGSTRWITVAGINIQVSQVMIPIVLLAIAKFSEMWPPPWGWAKLALLMTLVSLPAGLVFIQPNLSTTAIYILSISLALAPTCLTKEQLTIAAVSGVSIVVCASLFLQPYQKARITSFLSGGLNNEANYQARQSLIAVGSGQIWGRGLGQGVQSHLRFLPERQTDFIFASLAEELGLVGSLFVIATFAALVFYLIWLGMNTTNVQHQLYVYGLANLIFIQTMINIGMNIGIVPITGVTLPLVSYGGSSVLAFSAAYGIALHIALQQPTKAVAHFS